MSERSCLDEGGLWCGSPGRTFGVVEMDGSKVAEPHLLIKLIKHDFHPLLSSQVIAYKSTCSPSTFAKSSSALDFTGLELVGEQPKQQARLTCGEGVAGIQTHPHSGLVPHFVYDGPQLRELASHCAALAAHVLQHWVQRPDASITLTQQTCKYLISHCRRTS